METYLVEFFYFSFQYMSSALVSIRTDAFSSLEANAVHIPLWKSQFKPLAWHIYFCFVQRQWTKLFPVQFVLFLGMKMGFQLFLCSASLFILSRMGILERISTRIQLSVMKGVLQNWVAGQWKYLFSLIFSGTKFVDFQSTNTSLLIFPISYGNTGMCPFN